MIEAISELYSHKLRYANSLLFEVMYRDMYNERNI